MASSLWRSADRFASLLLLIASLLVLVNAQVNLDLCASFNTADTPKNISIYQTNGLCSDFCRADWAYSVTQDNGCWCSNFTPDESVQEDLSKCNINCPAYPIEKCGGRGLFGYVALNGFLPSGTKGGEDDAPSSTLATTTDVISTTEITETTETSETFSSSTLSKFSSIASEETTSATTKSIPTTMIQTITDSGTIRTVTVIPTETGSAEGDNNMGSVRNGGGLSTGAIIGMVVGIIGAILIAAGAILFWYIRRRKRSKEEGYQDDPSVRGSSSDRMGSAHPEMASGTPGSAAGGSNRNSTLQIDPRMDPFRQGLYMRTGSHESLNTLRDDRDYSRRILRTTNPDPDGLAP